MITKCEEELRTNEDLTPNEEDFAAFVELRQEVEALLKERATAYREEWKAKGRDPAPDEDEWYQIAESEDTGKGEIYEMGSAPQRGRDWPFNGSEYFRMLTMED